MRLPFMYKGCYIRKHGDSLPERLSNIIDFVVSLGSKAQFSDRARYRYGDFLVIESYCGEVELYVLVENIFRCICAA